MTEEGKRIYAEQRARDALRNWRACPLNELQEAAKIFDGALPLLICRLAGAESQ